MKIVTRFLLGAAASAGLVLGTVAPAEADVSPHKHCLYVETVDGYVLIAEGVSLYAPNDPALENFHNYVHLGEPTKTGGLKIMRIGINQDCPDPLPLSATGLTDLAVENE